MTYRLTYWPTRGRAEQIRLLLQEMDQPYQDDHVEKGDAFKRLQAEALWFGSVPMLQDGDFRLVQGPAILGYLARKHGLAPADPKDAARADAIVLGAEDLRIEYFRLFGDDGPARQARFVGGRWKDRWLPNLNTLLEKEGSGWFVGAALTQADVAVWDALDAVVAWVEGATLDAAPRLADFYQRVRARPRIAAYLASPRRAQG